MSVDRENSVTPRYSLVSYFLSTFLLSWAVWIAIMWLVPDLTADIGTFITVPGAWGPTIVALVMTARVEGRSGLRKLLSKLLRWRVRLQWYLLSIFGVTVVAVAASEIHILLGGTVPSLEGIAVLLGLPPEKANSVLVMLPFIFLVICAGGPLAEELGWRGFAQPQLQLRIGSAYASLIIGLIWSFWHLPLLIFVPSATGELPIGWYLPMVTAFGVLFGWVYNQTGGSVLHCILLHAGANFALGWVGAVSATGSNQLLTVFVVLICACSVLLFFRMARADKSERETTPT